VHEAADCRDVGEGEALIYQQQGFGPDYGASVCGGEAVPVGSTRGSKEGPGLGIGLARKCVHVAHKVKLIAAKAHLAASPPLFRSLSTKSSKGTASVAFRLTDR
jgi:hypothetical protein